MRLQGANPETRLATTVHWHLGLALADVRSCGALDAAHAADVARGVQLEPQEQLEQRAMLLQLLEAMQGPPVVLQR